MTAIGAHNTKIARRERLKAGVTIALREAFFGRAATMLANNFLEKFEANPLANECVHILRCIAQCQGVLHLGVGATGHFRELALHQLPLEQLGWLIVQNRAQSM